MSIFTKLLTYDQIIFLDILKETLTYFHLRDFRTALDKGHARCLIFKQDK